MDNKAYEKLEMQNFSPDLLEGKEGRPEKLFEPAASDENQNPLALHKEPASVETTKVIGNDFYSQHPSPPSRLKRTSSFLTTPAQLQSELSLLSIVRYNAAPCCKKTMRKKPSVMDPKRAPFLPEFPVLEGPEITIKLPPKPTTTTSLMNSSYGSDDSDSRRVALQAVGHNKTASELMGQENAQPAGRGQCCTPRRSSTKGLNQTLPSPYQGLPRNINLKMRTSTFPARVTVAQVEASSQTKDRSLDSIPQILSRDSLFLPL